MIHEIKEKYFSLDLENYILTFDDGLYSQYYWRDKIKKINTEKILFIISERILLSRDKTTMDNCYIANDKWIQKRDNSNYMTLNEIKEMEKLGFELGCHSHYHNKLYNNKELADFKSKLCYKNNISFLIEDCKKMKEWFISNIGYIPNKYCFPYNDETHFLKRYLVDQGFSEFYGNNRFNIDKII